MTFSTMKYVIITIVPKLRKNQGSWYDSLSFKIMAFKVKNLAVVHCRVFKRSKRDMKLGYRHTFVDYALCSNGQLIGTASVLLQILFIAYLKRVVYK